MVSGYQTRGEVTAHVMVKEKRFSTFTSFNFRSMQPPSLLFFLNSNSVGLYTCGAFLFFISPIIIKIIFYQNLFVVHFQYERYYKSLKIQSFYSFQVLPTYRNTTLLKMFHGLKLLLNLKKEKNVNYKIAQTWQFKGYRLKYVIELK